MQTFIMLTRLISEEVNPSFSIRKKEKEVAKKVKEYCPTIEWVGDYAILGPWDYIDIFRAPDTETAMKVSVLVRNYGGTHTEIWPAVNWDKFNDIMRGLTEVVEKE